MIPGSRAWPLPASENGATIIASISGSIPMSILHASTAAFGLLLLAGSAVAQTPAQADAATAGEKCETEVAETVRRMRGREAQEVQFVGAKRALTPVSDDETGVKGEGRYRGSAGRTMPFTYSCYYNLKTGATSGVVFRDAGGAPPVAEAPWQPDLSNVSPEACESAAAANLKERHPRVGRITLGSDSRQVRPGANGRIVLEGKGAVQPAPGMNAVPFSYACEFEGRRVVGVQTRE